MDIAINELSFHGKGAESDTELLRKLVQSFKAIKDRVAHIDRSTVRFCVADAWLLPRQLPSGTTIGNARAALDDVERGLCDCFFDYPGIPTQESPAFFHNGEPAHGLGHAHERQLLSAGIANGSHASDELSVESRRAGVESGTVPNVWRPELIAQHITTMERHVSVLPRYVDPGHHEPTSKHYIKTKSHIPRGARELFRYAYRDENSSWWTKCECNSFHRFQGGDPVHWNGTTSQRALRAIQDHEIPSSIRAYWKDRAGILDCGCR